MSPRKDPDRILEEIATAKTPAEVMVIVGETLKTELDEVTKQALDKAADTRLRSLRLERLAAGSRL